MSDEMDRLRQETQRLSQERDTLKSLVLESLRTGRPIDLFGDSTPQEMHQDRALVLAAFEGRDDNFRWDALPETIRLDPVVIVAAFEHNAIVWDNVPETLQRNHKVLALYGVKNSLIDADDCPCLLDRPFMKEQLTDHAFEWQILNLLRASNDSVLVGTPPKSLHSFRLSAMIEPCGRKFLMQRKFLIQPIFRIILN